MRTIHLIVLICVLALVTSVSSANMIDLSFSGGISQQTSWTAGVDALGQWYGPDFSLQGDTAMLDFAGTGKNPGQMRPDRRSMYIALPMPEPGTYNWQLDASLSDYHKQYMYWHAYKLSDGATVDLVGGPGWNNLGRDGKIIDRGYAPDGKDDESWYTYQQDFRITDRDFDRYDYIGFTLVGSRHSNEVLGFANVKTNATTNVPTQAGAIPEPSSLLLMLASCGMLLCTRRF
jgi:hypothetical protein